MSSDLPPVPKATTTGYIKFAIHEIGELIRENPISSTLCGMVLIGLAIGAPTQFNKYLLTERVISDANINNDGTTTNEEFSRVLGSRELENKAYNPGGLTSEEIEQYLRIKIE